MKQRTKFEPSKLQGFIQKQSTVVSWAEVMNYITSGALREWTERYRQTKDWQWKSRMLCITPACQLNGTGKEAADVVGLTGMVFVDIDGVPTEEIETVRARVNADPHTFASKVSVSGRGIHILAPYLLPDEGENPNFGETYAQAFLAVNCYYADLTGFAFDEKCSNVNRLMALNHDEKVYFNEGAEAFTEFLSQKPEQEDAPRLPTGTVCLTETPIDYAVRVVENHGEGYYLGNRHTYLMKCLAFMNKLGVSQSEAEGWALSYDLGEKEIRTLAKSVYNLYVGQHGTYSLPERRISLSHKLTATPHAHTRRGFPSYKWPRFIQQMVDCGDSKAQQDVILLSAFTVLGTMLGKLLRFKYSHRYWHPTLQLFVVAPPASGKSAVSLVRRVAEPLHDKLMASYDTAQTVYEKEKAAYDCAGRERANLPVPKAPVQRMFLIAANNSATGILENLADAPNHTALVCESEADTLSAAINSDFGGWDDTLRKAHDHDRLSFNRRANKEYRQIPRPCLGVLICGTPAQVRPLIPSAENGLFSRQLFISLPSIDVFVDQFDDDGEDLDAQFTAWGKEWLARLEQLWSHTSSIEMHLTAEQRMAFNAHFSLLFHHAGGTQPNHHMKSSVAREAINVLRMMSVVALLRALETGDGLVPAPDLPAENLQDGICPRYDLAVTPRDFQAVLALAEPLYRNACDVLSLLPSTEVVRNTVSLPDLLLTRLPLRFTRTEALKIGEELGVTVTNVDTMLQRLTDSGKLIRTCRGSYRFPDEVAATGSH